MKSYKTFFFLLCIIKHIYSSAIAPQIAYQGIITDGAGNPLKDSTYTLDFSLYTDSSGGAVVWTEQKKVSIKNGIFSHLLGSSTPFGTLPFDEQYWLSIKRGGDEVGLRIKLAIVPYAKKAFVADSAKCVNGKNIVSNSIDSSKICYNTIGTANISEIDGKKIISNFGNQIITGKKVSVDTIQTLAITSNTCSISEYIENGISISEKYLKNSYNATFTGNFYTDAGHYIRLATVKFPNSPWHTATILATNSFYGIQHCNSVIISLSNSIHGIGTNVSVTTLVKITNYQNPVYYYKKLDDSTIELWVYLYAGNGPGTWYLSTIQNSAVKIDYNLIQTNLPEGLTECSKGFLENQIEDLNQRLKTLEAK